MEYNEQYFHYRQVEIRLALARANCTKDGLQIARSVFPHFFETCHGSSGCIWWKLSVNARSPHALPQRSVPTMTPWMPWSCLPCSKSNMSCYLFVCTVSWLGWWLWVKSWCFQRNWKHCKVLYLAWAPTNGENCLQWWWWSVQRCSCYDQSSYACISGDFAVGNEDHPLIENWDTLL